MRIILLFPFFLFLVGCSKSNDNNNESKPTLLLNSIRVDDQTIEDQIRAVNISPLIELDFSNAIAISSAINTIQLIDQNRTIVPIDISTSSNGKKINVKPKNALSHLSKYQLNITSGLMDNQGSRLQTERSFFLHTKIDLSDKFARISTDELLTLTQKQTFKYFWDFAHPASGLARERNTSGDIVTTGGTGFGVMAILVGIERGFISKNEGKERIQKIVTFLKGADKYHGAFSHWYNGNTGRTQKFSEQDDGADLVETALLLQGLLAARQYFSESIYQSLQNDITKIYDDVEWPFFQNGQQVLHWHWSPNHGFAINLKIRGWNEALIVYALAAGSNTHPIAKSVYDEGWAMNGNMRNGTTNYEVNLPLGPRLGGPLFLSQYSFMGINPKGLKDEYADYELQTKNHTLTNRAYCIANPKNFYGYSEDLWGLTASDDLNGYKVHSPTEDNSVITPTAALSSFAFTPAESLKVLEFLYYKLGNKIWGDYGFYDAFSLHELWFANSYIAIDQGPIIISIENYRTQLIWNLFMQIPEVKKGLKSLNFTSPKL